MGIERGALPTAGFTIVPNDWLRDPRISWKAKGLLAYIASHQEGYQLTRDQIVSEATDGRDSVLAGMRELEDAGYLTRVKVRGEGGKIDGTLYRLGEPVSGKSVPGSDQGKHGTSPGEASDGFSGSGEPAGKKTNPKKTTSEKNTSSASPRRGTRLPDDFQVTQEMRDWYRDNVGNAIDGLIEHEKFLDYWRAAPGAKGVKLDWPATWRNWMRTAMERAGTRPTSGAPAGAAGTKPRYPSAAEREQARREQEHAEMVAAETFVEANGGDPENLDQVLAVVAKIRSGELPLADRTVMPYIEGQIVRDNGAPREVTSYASE